MNSLNQDQAGALYRNMDTVKAFAEGRLCYANKEGEVMPVRELSIEAVVTNPLIYSIIPPPPEEPLRPIK